MSRKIAVAVVHGIGRQSIDFVDGIRQALDARCHADCGDDVIVRPVHWAPVLQAKEDDLMRRMEQAGEMNFTTIRRLLIDFVGDGIAYQIAPGDREVYDSVHSVFATTLRQLASDAGADAPLCIIAHSLGTVIASNFIYDLQVDQRRPIISDEVRAQMTDTPLEKGETITLLYTLGSPLALWSLRYREFGRPVTIPDPRLADHHPALRGEWINIYDRDDVIGFPLKTLNDVYGRVVTRDIEFNVGGAVTSWNPAAHLGYWSDDDVVTPMANAIIRTWKAINGGSLPA